MAAVAANRTVGLAAKPNIINCWFVVDNSASMSGAKIGLAANGVLNCMISSGFLRSPMTLKLSPRGRKRLKACPNSTLLKRMEMGQRCMMRFESRNHMGCTSR